jgi:hypothetical protein
MFGALLSNPQEALNKHQLVYCVSVMSVGCTRVGVELSYNNPLTESWLSIRKHDKKLSRIITDNIDNVNIPS